MLRNSSLKKITLTTLLLLVALILYNYPKEINEHISISQQKRIIYLIDENNYVGMTEINYDNIKQYIKSLIIGETNLPNNFKAVIPEKTKLLDYNLNEGLLKINFSKEFLNVPKEQEESMLESIVFSLTSLDEVDKIMIFIEGEHLKQLPHSQKKLNLYLDRNYGINKVYDINSFKETSMVTVYYSKDNYYIPVSYITNNDNDKVDIIIKHLKSTIYSHSNLSTKLNYNLALTNYDISDNILNLNFNDFFLDNVLDGKITEEVKYTLFYSFHDTLGIKEIIFSINNSPIEQFRLES